MTESTIETKPQAIAVGVPAQLFTDLFHFVSGIPLTGDTHASRLDLVGRMERVLAASPPAGRMVTENELTDFIHQRAMGAIARFKAGHLGEDPLAIDREIAKAVLTIGTLVATGEKPTRGEA